MRQNIFLAASVLLLAACATPQERAAKMQLKMDRIIIEYGPACVRLGYQQNSDQWRNCILQLSTKDDIARYGTPTHVYGGFGRSHWGGGGLWGPYW